MLEELEYLAVSWKLLGQTPWPVAAMQRVREPGTSEQSASCRELRCTIARTRGLQVFALLSLFPLLMPSVMGLSIAGSGFHVTKSIPSAWMTQWTS